jgi:hypothetical protein
MREALVALVDYLMERRRTDCTHSLSLSVSVCPSFGCVSTSLVIARAPNALSAVSLSVAATLLADPKLARIVDTSLLKACVAAERPQSALALIRMGNHCDVHDCAEALLEQGVREVFFPGDEESDWVWQLVSEMVELYRSKSMHEPALRLLQECAFPLPLPVL